MVPCYEPFEEIDERFKRIEARRSRSWSFFEKLGFWRKERECSEWGKERGVSEILFLTSRLREWDSLRECHEARSGGLRVTQHQVSSPVAFKWARPEPMCVYRLDHLHIFCTRIWNREWTGPTYELIWWAWILDPNRKRAMGIFGPTWPWFDHPYCGSRWF